MSSNQLPTIAMVGANHPMLMDDEMRLSLARELFGAPEVAALDFVNLELGRDFLDEDRRYDAVVVHSVFHSNNAHTMRICTSRFDSCRVSPLHSVARWRRRLESTGAELIVVWELLPCALSGWNLEGLKGYKIERRDGRVTAYRRIG